MKMRVFLMAAAMVAGSQLAMGQLSILSSTDPILAIDEDGIASNSSYPGGEAPMFALDEMASTKYLNFGASNSGLIVTPGIGSSTVQSMLFTTANDAPERDPAAWTLFGTNDAIQSMDNSAGDGGENWVEIGSGMAMLPDARGTDGPVISVANTAAYSSYRLLFPELKDGGLANSMQIADVRFFESADGTGSSFLGATDPVLAIHAPAPDSNYPGPEGPMFALDNDPATKYLNFGDENSGFIVTPQGPNASELIASIRMTTANDSPERDPASFEIYGTNDPILSGDNSAGNGETWTLIDAGTVDLPTERFAVGEPVAVSATEAYSSYKIVFPTVRDANGGIMQVADVDLFAVPEPSSMIALVLGLCGLSILRRQS